MRKIRIPLLKLIGVILIFSLLSGALSSLQPGGEIVLASPEANYIKVAPSGNDTAGCGTDSMPCQTIQYAVNKAVSGDVILVASGTYTYRSSTDNCGFLVTRAVVCFVDKHLTILGGYTSNDWAISDPDQNLTVLDGQNSSRGVAIIAYNSTASIRMEGFTIQNGLAQGNSNGGDFYTYAFGGGMWAQKGSVILRNMLFKNNRSIGGSTSSEYGGGGSGGGLAIQSAPNGDISILERVIFDGNQAIGGSGSQRGGVALGGGLFTYKSAIIGENIIATNNTAQAGSSNGNGFDSIHGLRADALGGGIALQVGSTANLTNITAIENRAIGGNAGTTSAAVGGGAFGGAISAEQSQLTLIVAELKNNTIMGGQAATGGFAFGGGIITDGTNSTLERINIIHNAAISGASSTGGNSGGPSGGGAYLTSFIYGPGYETNISNSVFADNWIEVGAPGKSIGGGGAGLVVQAMTANINHSTFANNYFVGDLKCGQAVMVNGLYGSSGLPATANFNYSIIADHIHPYTNYTSAVTVAEGSTANFHQGIFSNNTNNTNIDDSPLPAGTILGLSSMYEESAIQFASPGSPDYDYHLISTSPAINRAVQSNLLIDMDGQTRPVSGYADIGADEYAVPTLVSSPSKITVLTDDDAEITYQIAIDLPYEPTTTWTASTSTSWLYLGATGTSKQVSGLTGQELIVRFDSSEVKDGAYTGSIIVTSAGANPTTINVNLLKLEHVYQSFLPVVNR